QPRSVALVSHIRARDTRSIAKPPGLAAIVEKKSCDRWPSRLDQGGSSGNNHFNHRCQMIPFLRHLFLHDLSLKLFSLALAVLIWLTVTFAIRKEYSPIANLKPRNAVPATYVLPVVVLA